VVISAIVWTLNRLWKILRRITFKAGRLGRRQQRIVEFYERFRRLVANQGHVRAATRTHREFAGTIERDWQHANGLMGSDGLAHLPTRLAEAFYRVRFGDESLSLDELQDINASLDLLEQRINGAAGPADDV
jgi:hypothetical protein